MFEHVFISFCNVWMKCGVDVCAVLIASRQQQLEVAVMPVTRRDISTNRDVAVTAPMMSTLCLGTAYHRVMTSMADEPMIAISMITKYVAVVCRCVHVDLTLLWCPDIALHWQPNSLPSILPSSRTMQFWQMFHHLFLSLPFQFILLISNDYSLKYM